jgi:CRP-like cAMP-binding protein
MLELRFAVQDLSRIRFAVSPVQEAVSAVRALATASAASPHAPWLRWVRPRVDATDFTVLSTLIRPEGYIPDFLVPAPIPPTTDVESGLAQVASAEPSAVREQLRHLAAHPVAQRGPGHRARLHLLDELAAEPEAALRRIVSALHGWWAVAVEPHWSRVRALAHDDISYRLDELAAGGVERMFRTLHPRVRFSGDRLRIVKYYSGTAHLQRRGLMLVPSVFAWPDVLVSTGDPNVATLIYAPRGLGRLWQQSGGGSVPALAALLGRSRATVLSQLVVPMSTTELAVLLGLTAPTVSAHLKILEAAGLVHSRRDGHSVRYRRTRLGEALVNGSR